MTMSLRCSVLFLATVCVTGIVAAESRAKDSCMVHWMVRAGVSHTKTKRAEQRMLQVGIGVDDIAKIRTNIVSFLLLTTPTDSNKLRSCFAGSSKACQNYSPCKHGGKCMTSLSKKEHVCKCPLDYSGNFCQIPHPAPLRDLRVLVKTVKELKKTQAEHGRMLKCQFPFLARKHYTWRSPNNGKDNGQIQKVTFIKKQENTILLLLYSSTIRELNAGVHAHWDFKIDGQECSRPAKIRISMHHNIRVDLHIPAVLLGTCQATSRGRIGKGRHTISVHIKSSDGYSGWEAPSFMEIKEICRDRQ